MFSIEKTYHFEAAHRLTGHNGRCANLHGHSYRVDVRVETVGLVVDPGASDDGMVMDFAVLDEIMDPTVDMMDHRLIVPENEESVYHAMFSSDLTESIYPLPVSRTTAEELARFFVEIVVGSLVTRDHMHPSKVIATEPPTSF